MKTGLTANELDRPERRNTPIPKRSFIREKTDIDVIALPVYIQGNQYIVDFGQGSSPRFHKVSKNKECSCGAQYCEAIEAVHQYLQAGGLRAPDIEGMPPCPICGGRTYRDRNWDGKYTKTLGWRCEKGGLRHFLEAKAERIKQQLAVNPWLIPPAPGYPGVRRDGLMTWEECQRAEKKLRLEVVDDPGI
ncbi:MAG: hypothetical protein PHQ40_18940 [Anaerolineaceae bacterium]|nr:hypothetical protein [Anaerolineaceae bacterium]